MSEYTDEQIDWCKSYKRLTGFEPLMDDFEAGNESFEIAAIFSKQWFENWASDALGNIPNIPGVDA